MKKTLKLMVFTIFVLSITVLTLGSCDFDISGILGEYVCVHEWSEWDIVEQGDCKTPGLIQRECLNCGAIDEETTALKEHTEGEWVVDKEATCIEDGSKHTECSVCGTTISTEKILSAGVHSESDWIIDKEATCTEDGLKHIECTICGITITEESIDTTGTHKYENHNCIYCGLTGEECFEFTYLPESDSYEIKANKNCDLPNEISLPSTYNGKYVTSIGSWAFSDCPSLTSVVIPNSITSISRRTFFNCSNITSIYIPDSVTSICDEAFLGCSSLTSVVIGNSVTSIGKYAFNFCVNLTHVYYNGTLKEWEYIDIYLDSNIIIMIGNTSEFSNFSLTNATRYYYSENRPTTSGRFWHWGENGEVVVWK